jgi:hypothetical protein
VHLPASANAALAPPFFHTVASSPHVNLILPLPFSALAASCRSPLPSCRHWRKGADLDHESNPLKQRICCVPTVAANIQSLPGQLQPLLDSSLPQQGINPCPQASPERTC